MSKIHFIGGEKGGVGKSFSARLLAQYHVDNNILWSGYDTDQSHSTFSRFYGEFTNKISTKGSALDDVLEQLYDQPEKDIIVDLAAQTAANLKSWMEDCDFFSLVEETQTEVYFWHVLDDSADCKNLLGDTLTWFGDKPCHIVIVKNHGCGENFKPLENSNNYLRAIAVGAQTLEIPGLPAAVNQKIDFDDLSFWAAANNPHWLNRIERQRVSVWLKKAYADLDHIFKTDDETNTTEQSQTTPA